MKLHRTFKVRLRLADFVQEDKTLVAAAILDWCDEREEMATVAEGFLQEYLSRHGLDPGQVFAG